MFLLDYIIIVIYLTVAINSENIKTCPRFCKCDSYMLLNRAQCSSKHLISAEVDVPYQVQILDLSLNDITTVDKNCFKHLSHLKYLNLSNNALHTLDLEAFSNLPRLLELDLSHNRLEYLDERLFSKNRYLFKINLEGNKFISLLPKMLIKSAALKELNLKNSRINFLHSELFAGVTNLIELDLSKNLLNNFNVEDFKCLTKLKKLNLNENFIKCDESIKAKLRRLNNKGINIILDSCSLENINELKQSSTQMLEKMVMASSNLEDISEENKFSSIWQWRLHIDNEEQAGSSEEDEWELSSKERKLENGNNDISHSNTAVCSPNNIKLCQDYQSCLQNLKKTCNEKHLQSEKYSVNDVQFAFFLGLALGISTVIIILVCALWLKGCMHYRRKVIPLDDLPSQPMARPVTQLPPNIRRQPRRRAAASTRPIVRYEGPVTENFLSRLFGRPARHQYYRSINQNTATLIRRLSRSNLFNNRLSQHFMERQTSSEIHNTPNIENDSFTPSAPRAETPPPSYGDVVIHNCEQEK